MELLEKAQENQSVLSCQTVRMGSVLLFLWLLELKSRYLVACDVDPTFFPLCFWSPIGNYEGDKLNGGSSEPSVSRETVNNSLVVLETKVP